MKNEVSPQDLQPAPHGPSAGAEPQGPGVHSPAQPTEITPVEEDEPGGVRPGREPGAASDLEGPTDTPQGSGGGGADRGT